MIVCQCKGITDTAIRAAARAGATTVCEITQMAGAGGDCGGCTRTVAAILEAVRPAQRSPQLRACDSDPYLVPALVGR